MSDERPSRERLVTASLELMRRHGYAGTGVKAILTASAVPYGSLYHHFPGGKEELGAETLRQGGLVYLGLVEAFFPPGVDVVEATAAFFEGAAEFVASTDFVDACPIATIAGEIAGTSQPMRTAAAEAFESWLAALRDRMAAAGIPDGRAGELAIELFCGLEGAFLLARTIRDVEPILVAGRAATAAVGAAVRAAAVDLGASRPHAETVRARKGR